MNFFFFPYQVYILCGYYYVYWMVFSRTKFLKTCGVCTPISHFFFTWRFVKGLTSATQKWKIKQLHGVFVLPFMQKTLIVFVSWCFTVLSVLKLPRWITCLLLTLYLLLQIERKCWDFEQVWRVGATPSLLQNKKGGNFFFYFLSHGKKNMMKLS